MSYGKIIKQLRIENNVKQSVLANKLNISESNLSMVENGKRKLHRQDFIKALNYLGYSLNPNDKKEEKPRIKALEKLKDKGWELSQGGYSKDFISLNNKYISVELNEYGYCCYILKDVELEGEYLTWNKYYSKDYDDIYHDKYHYIDDNFVNIIGLNDETNTIEINKTNIFSNEIEKELMEDLKTYFKYLGMNL